METSYLVVLIVSLLGIAGWSVGVLVKLFAARR